MNSVTAHERRFTIREASELSGKSISTIKRLVREIVLNPKSEDRNLVYPSVDEVATFRLAGESFVWKIGEVVLRKRFNNSSSKISDGLFAKNVNTHDNAISIIEVLRVQLQSKDRQIETLEKQLDRKDDQIRNLGKRMHESNVLMRELQNRLAIAGPAHERTLAPTATEPKSQRTKSRPTNGPKRKRHSILDFLIGRP